MGDDGHRYTFGAPARGWPSFDGEGRVVKEETTRLVMDHIDVALAESGADLSDERVEEMKEARRRRRASKGLPD